MYLSGCLFVVVVFIEVVIWVGLFFGMWMKYGLMVNVVLVKVFGLLYGVVFFVYVVVMLFVVVCLCWLWWVSVLVLLVVILLLVMLLLEWWFKCCGLFGLCVMC